MSWGDARGGEAFLLVIEFPPGVEIQVFMRFGLIWGCGEWGRGGGRGRKQMVFRYAGTLVATTL